MDTLNPRLRSFLSNQRSVALIVVALSILGGAMLLLSGPFSAALVLALVLVILKNPEQLNL